VRLTGARRLQRQLKQLPQEVQEEVQKVIRRNTEAGARMARQLVPVASGQLKAWIHTKYDTQDGFRGSIEAAPPTKEAQIKARAVEFGRTKGNRGKTQAAPYMRIMQSHLGKKFRNNVRNAIRRAARKVTNG
jgi:hypothetical protein